MNSPYAGYDVLSKWDSPSFDAATRGVLSGRLTCIPPRRFLSPDEWSLMEALAARLLPQPERAAPIPITPWIDALLFSDQGEGFRHANMPPLRAAWRSGLAAIDAEARHRRGAGFGALPVAEQDALLEAIAAGDVAAICWQDVPAQRFFTDILLKTVVGIYYAHPSAWSEIGFGGPASPRGYVRLGFSQRDGWEARERR
jgi:hypothetical protein